MLMIKVGVLGAGHLGKIHIKLLLELSSQFEVIGFYDPDQQQAETVSQKFNIKAFNSVKELLEEVDAIDIVTPTLNHYDCMLQAIKQDKHIFVEKPITNTIEEAEFLESILPENLKVQVGHVERFNGAFLAAKDKINNPMFIEGHRLAPFNQRGTDVSVVLDLMIHDLDIILSRIKSPVKDVRASGVAVISNSPDIANARIEFLNGCVANLTASRISLKTMRKIRFFQDNGYISVDFGNSESEAFELTEEPSEQSLQIQLGEQTRNFQYSQPETRPVNAIKEELSSFGSSIENDLSTVVSFDDGKRALILAHQILEKIQSSNQ